MLEQLYTIINDRYQDERSVIVTADVEQPSDLAQHVGKRTYSRLIELCGDPKQLSGEDRRIKVRRVELGPPGGGGQRRRRRTCASPRRSVTFSASRCSSSAWA